MKSLFYLTLLMCLCVLSYPSTIKAQSTHTTLGWDYPVDEEVNIDRFILQRKVGTGEYMDVRSDINKSARVVTDTSTPTGVVVCYVMFAERGASGSGVRSIASNEPCFAALAPVTNLRKK